MNILLYVITILMLLTTITYSKLESFRALMGSQAGFIHYMGAIEKGAAEKAADFWYKKIHFKRAQTASRETNEKIPGSRLSFHLFVDAHAREQANEVYSQTRELAKRLITYLYRDAKFFPLIIIWWSSFSKQYSKFHSISSVFSLEYFSNEPRYFIRPAFTSGFSCTFSKNKIKIILHIFRILKNRQDIIFHVLYHSNLRQFQLKFLTHTSSLLP